jgi:hypothetical protein
MRFTTRDCRARLIRLEARLRGRDLSEAERQRLRHERDVLSLVLINRRIEGARPVVDLARWRSANGAAALVDRAGGPPAPRAALS